MSARPRGPGWWRGFDGNWYPPPHPAVRSLHPVATHEPVEAPTTVGRRWPGKHLVVLVVLVLLASAVAAGSLLG